MGEESLLESAWVMYLHLVNTRQLQLIQDSVASSRPHLLAYQELSGVSHSFSQEIHREWCLAAGGFQFPYIQRCACMELGLARRLTARGIPLHTPGWRVSLRFGMQVNTWNFHYTEKQREKSAG